MNRRLVQFSCLTLAFLFFGCSRDASSVRLAAMKQADDYVQREQYTQAIVAYRIALQADPKSGEVHLKLADTYSEDQGCGERGPRIHSCGRRASRQPENS